MKKGPSRIKVSLVRPLTYSEIEFVRNFSGVKFRDKSGIRFTASIAWEPATRVFPVEVVPYVVRISKNEQLYFESDSLDSRRLYGEADDFLAKYFINLHGTAVKTLRELG